MAYAAWTSTRLIGARVVCHQSRRLLRSRCCRLCRRPFCLYLGGAEDRFRSPHLAAGYCDSGCRRLAWVTVISLPAPTRPRCNGLPEGRAAARPRRLKTGDPKRALESTVVEVRFTVDPFHI